jgi:predicted NBD/HSP70 family sugar kinase
MAQQVDRQPAARRARRTAGLSGSNLSRVSDFNQRVVLQAIRLAGEVSRSELASETGLTFPTIVNITKKLMDDGVVHESRRIKGPRGSPATRLAVSPDGCFALGVNIDRDHLMVVILDLVGEVRARDFLEIDFPTPEAVVAYVGSWFNKTIRELKLPKSRFVGAGVALPDDLGSIPIAHKPPAFTSWSTVDIGRTLYDALGLPIQVDNDAAAAALGEAQFGAGRQYNDFFYVLISSGLGGAVIVDHDCVRGGLGRAGEIGLLPIDLSSPGGQLVQDLVSLSELRLRLEADGSPTSLGSFGRDLDPDSLVVQRWAVEAARSLVAPLLNVRADSIQSGS